MSFEFCSAPTADLEVQLARAECERCRDVVAVAAELAAWIDQRAEAEPHAGPDEAPASIPVAELRLWVSRLTMALAKAEVDEDLAVVP